MVDFFIGRDPELAQIEEFLSRMPGGVHVLAIEGEPGMGKSTLWLQSLETAKGRGWRVLSSRPSAAEATFAYAGLGDLLATSYDEALTGLSAPQQRALNVPLLREEPDGPMVDAVAVAVGLLNLLRALSEKTPILVAVDDVQWLDSPSLLALSFAVRRLRDEPIGLVVARRTEASVQRVGELDPLLAGEAIERLTVGPLGIASLDELLRSQLAVTLPRTALERIHGTSGGNPLFALELGKALGDVSADTKAGTDLPLPDELRALIGAQVEQLPPSTRDTLAIAAALAHPTDELVAEAADHPIDEAMQAAIDARFIAVSDGRIRFTHPLRAVAVRAGTSRVRRREIHSRLAAVVTDPEERARHLALAADGPDEATASELTAVAERAAARGAPRAAAELVGLARELTPPADLEMIRTRGLREGTYFLRGGDPLRALNLANDLLASWPPSVARGPALVLLGHAEYGLDLHRSAAVFVEALSEAGDDDRLRMRCEGSLTGILDLLGQDIPEALAHGRAELEIAERVGDDVHTATALRGIARNEQRLTGKMPVKLIERSLELEPAIQATANTVGEWPRWCYAEMLAWTDELRTGLATWAALDEATIERGDERARIQLLAEVTFYECIIGAWDEALAHADECIDLTSGTKSHYTAMAYGGRALAEAHRGEEDAARRAAEEALRLAPALPSIAAERGAAWALGILELSLADPGQAHQHLGPLVEGRRQAGVREPGEMRFVSDEIEALIGMDRFDEAEALLDWYESLAQASGRVFAIAACLRCRGLLYAARGDTSDALAALQESRDRYATIEDPFGLARTLLALGSVRRRARRNQAAREALDAAVGAFEGLGARLWADRARAELGRIGGRAPSPDGLTASERRIADLVADGRTNREVAASLFVTERTVEGHLTSVYAKLGIRSRTELARKLASDAETTS